MDKSPITTHILDTSRGKPAQGVEAELQFFKGNESWTDLGRGVTNEDGRISDLLSTGHKLEPGHYRLTFHTQKYFSAQGIEGFYPLVQINFQIKDGNQHYHVPLLLNPFGYSTYRGS
jgi:5-hydroxyisourate hydrolase